MHVQANAEVNQQTRQPGQGRSHLFGARLLRLIQLFEAPLSILGSAVDDMWRCLGIVIFPRTFVERRKTIGKASTRTFAQRLGFGAAAGPLERRRTGSFHPGFHFKNVEKFHMRHSACAWKATSLRPSSASTRTSPQTGTRIPRVEVFDDF